MPIKLSKFLAHIIVILVSLAPTCLFAKMQFKASSSGQGQWAGGVFPDTAFEGVRYVSSQFLESLFGNEGSWVPDRQKFLIPDSTGKKWYFTLDNPYMNVGDEIYNLGFPVRRGPDYLYLPYASLRRILYGRGLVVDLIGPAMQTTDAVSPTGTGNILEVGTEERGNGTLVTVKTSQKLEWEGYWVPPHFLLKLQAGKLAPQYPVKTPGKGLVKEILTVQEKDMAQVTLYIPKEIDTVEASYSAENQAYQILVHKKTNKPAEAEAGDQDKKDSKGPATIIIDPGHGGKDQGAQVGGVAEAQVTLAVGKELKAALTKMGFRALLTRASDTFIELKDRPKFASDQGGDLFVSLHCNSIGGSSQRKKTVSGFTAYILRDGESEEDKTLARRENQAISEESGKNGKSEISPVEWILLEHQLNLYGKESEAFIDQVVKEFNGFTIPKYATGASQAGFYVLVGAYMPAVLFEMGFLTHEKDRRILASEKGQKQLAERMAKAIQKYRQSLVKKSGTKESKAQNAK